MRNLTNPNNTSYTLKKISGVMKNNRTLLLSMVAIVVFISTYLLILPAMALDEDEAAEQGGIDLPASEQMTEAEAQEPETKAEEAQLTDVPDEPAFAGDGYTITLDAGKSAKLPEGTKLTATEVTVKDENYEAWCDEAVKALQESSDVTEDINGLKSARFYDITLQADGSAVEPADSVGVNISYDKALKMKSKDDVKVIHFGVDKKGNLKPEVLKDSAVDVRTKQGSKGTIEVSEVAFNATGFSMYGVVEMEMATEVTLPGSDDTYEVSVTYGADAKLPEDVRLDVTALSEDNDDYLKAKNALIEAKKTENENFDAKTLGFSAMDISIIDNESGEKVEPAEGAEVNVSLKIKTLPENIDKAVLGESIEIRHVNESSGTTEIETVAKAADVNVAGGSAEADFTVESFSTFTISWDVVTDDYVNLRWRSGNSTRGQVVINYVNSEGDAISRPNGVVNNGTNNHDVSSSNWPDNEEVIISGNNVARNINGRSYEKAYIVVNGNQQTITRILQSRTGNNYYRTDYYNENTLIYSAEGSNMTGGNAYYRPNVYLQYTSIPNEGNNTTIHFGYMENGQFVEFEENPSPEFDSAERAYLIYDFDGYQYEGHTYYCTSETKTPDDDGTRVQAMLRNNNGNWQYHNYSTTYSTSGWINIAKDSHFYLVYEKKPEVQQGGTPTVKPVNPDEVPAPPSLTKNSKNNTDGTNTISLEIAGNATELEVMKLADVIVVFDSSTSMNWNMAGSQYYNVPWTQQRLYYAKNATKSLARSLLEKENSLGEKLVRLHLVTFNDHAQLETLLPDFTTDYNEFAAAVGNSATTGITTSSGTNWEDGLTLANSLTVDPGRATFVIFVTDGEPTARISRTEHTDQELIDAGTSNDAYILNSIFNTRGYQYNYDAAVPAAQAIVNAGKNLYTIGISNDVSSLAQLTDEAGAGAGHNFTAETEEQLNQAFDDIQASIIALLGESDIHITDGITSLTSLEAKVLETIDPNSFKYYRYGGAQYKYGADYEHKTEWTTRAADGCAAATYNEETGTVNWEMGENFQLEDGVTYVIEFRVWPSQEAYDLIANLNNGTKVYRVKTGDDDAKGLTQDEYDQIIENRAPVFDTDGNCTLPGDYSLKTNTDEVGATYKLGTKTGATVTYEEGTEPQDVIYTKGTLQPMDLMSELMTIKKEWAHEFNESHAGDQVKFYLKVGDAGYYQNDGTVSPSETNADSLVLKNPDWVESIYVAPGMMDYINGAANVLETGHEYELYEYEITQTDSEDNYIASYDFISEIVRPMRVNGVLKFLVKYTEESEIPEGVTETYTIDNKTYYVRPGTGDSGLLSGTNHRRAEMDITKIINKGTSSMTEEQLNKEVFTYRVTLKMPADADLSLITGWQFVYRPDDPNWTIQGYQEDDTPLSGDETRFAGNNFRWGTFNYNGTPIGQAVTVDPDDPDYVTITMDLSMYPNQVLRLTNLPMGTEYRIEEVYANNRTLGSNGLMSNASTVPTTSVPSNLAEEGYAQTTSASKYGTASGNVISGTIDNPNRRYYNQFTNTLGNITAAELQVTKHLSGYTWSGERYYFALEAGIHTKTDGTEGGPSPLPASTSLYLSNSTGSDDRSYGFGSIKYSEEGTYTYTVKEARYRPGNSTSIVDIDQSADTIPNTNIVFEKPVTITVTVSKDAFGSLFVDKVEGARTELSGTVINTTFTNSQPCYVKILKVGDATDPLSGVQFAVYSDRSMTTPVNEGTVTTDSNGFASLGSMISGVTYYLVETNTAAGYHQISKPVLITFDGTSVTATCEQDGVIFVTPEWIYQENDGTWVVKINNTSGTELPSTGGPGTLVYTLSGLLLILGVAVLYAFRRRRREV